MKNILISMSRRRSLMVPVVTLMAIGIGISGYYIQNQQIQAKQEAEQQAKQAKSDQQLADPANLSTKDTVDQSTKVTEDGQAANVVDVTFTVENVPGESEVRLSAKIDSKEPGICTFYLKQGNYGPEETVVVKDSACEVRFGNPGIDSWEAKVLYTSTDGKTRGDAQTTIQL